MNSLYELSNNYIAVQQMIENAEPEELEMLNDTLDAINDSVEVKAENIIKFYFNLKGDADKCKAEAQRLSAKSKALENKAERMKEYLDRELNAMGLDKLKAGTFNLSYRKSKAVEVEDIAVLSDEYKKVAVTADKMAIKRALQDGVEVAGAKLVENRNLNIK